MAITVKHAPSAETLASQVAGAYELERSERDLRANQQIGLESARLQQQAALAAMAEQGQNQRHQASLRAQVAQQRRAADDLNAYRQGSMALQGRAQALQAQAQHQRAYADQRNFELQVARETNSLLKNGMDSRLKAAGEAVRSGKAKYTDAQRNTIANLDKFISGPVNPRRTPLQHQADIRGAIRQRNNVLVNPMEIPLGERQKSIEEKVNSQTFERTLASGDTVVFGLDDHGQPEVLHRSGSWWDNAKTYETALVNLGEAEDRLRSSGGAESAAIQMDIQRHKMILSEMERRLEITPNQASPEVNSAGMPGPAWQSQPNTSLPAGEGEKSGPPKPQTADELRVYPNPGAALQYANQLAEKENKPDGAASLAMPAPPDKGGKGLAAVDPGQIYELNDRFYIAYTTPAEFLDTDGPISFEEVILVKDFTRSGRQGYIWIPEARIGTDQWPGFVRPPNYSRTGASNRAFQRYSQPGAP